MFYTLHQLQILVKVAEHQSITKAADDLNLSQPAISIQLKNLQFLESYLLDFMLHWIFLQCRNL